MFLVLGFTDYEDHEVCEDYEDHDVYEDYEDYEVYGDFEDIQQSVVTDRNPAMNACCEDEKIPLPLLLPCM